MNSENILSDSGVKKLADKLCGYISYLNREQDPTQFAQPIMIEVPVIMSHIEDSELRKEFFLQGDKEGKALNKREQKDLATERDTNIKELNRRLRETQKNIKALIKERQTRCKTMKNKEEKARCMKESEDERKKATEKLGPKPEITRFKGLGEISPDEFGNFIGKDIRLEPVMLKEVSIPKLLEYFMGKNTPERQEFILGKLRVEKDVIVDDRISKI